MKFFLRVLLFFSFFTCILYGDESYTSSELFEVINQETATIQRKNGKFIGVSLGGSLFLPEDVDVKIMPTIGIKSGVYTFFNPYVGVRGSADFYLGAAESRAEDYFAMLALLSLGIDMIAEFPLSKSQNIFLGGLLGIGGEAYIYYDNNAYSSFSNMRKQGHIFMQTGITLMLGKLNRINIIYRLIPSRNASEFDPNGFVMMEYAFKF